MTIAHGCRFAIGQQVEFTCIPVLYSNRNKWNDTITVFELLSAARCKRMPNNFLHEWIDNRNQLFILRNFTLLCLNCVLYAFVIPCICNYCMRMQKGRSTPNYTLYGKNIYIFCDCLLGDFYKHHECDSTLEKNFKNGKYHIKCRKFKQGCTMFVLQTRLLSWH